ncbi:alanine dehydrogenase [candidate division MSBL1 archaeon SCGC-AAA382M17]|uniref:alanine dehydrogenase n=1 Tax=candidate division MSBL1 archaeon SCGC-AAA382M17 TaxID=1698284 RepID=A0ABR5TK11_9EURY|nr:alanine dehydrogenase [candidate division MSBL1 archaeon SCGC-AAA382M17]
MKKNQSSYFSLEKAGIFPQEEMLEVGRKHNKLVIGIPKDNHKIERRVALTPEAVEVLVNQGHEVIIESGAGEAANYQDQEYSENGGFIVREKDQVYQCDIIIRISPLNEDEIDRLKGNQIIFTNINLPQQNAEYIQKLMQKRVIAIAFEYLREEDNSFPVIKAMSEIAGTTSILVASEYLSNSREGKGVLLGGVSGITPAEIVILGAGTAAEYAAKAAIGLGASVKIFDYSLIKLRRLQKHIGTRLYTSVFHPKVLKKDIQSADVIIGAMYQYGNYPQYLLNEDMITQMKDGSVIVDLSIDQGGCIETSEIRTIDAPSFVKYGVIHYCVPNIASRVSRTASIALSNVFSPMLIAMGEYGGFINHLKENRGLRYGVYIYNGILTKKQIGNRFGMTSRDIDLLMAAF